MTNHTHFLEVGAAATGGFRVIHVRGTQLQQQVVMDTAADVAAAAKLCGVPVHTQQPNVRECCRQLRVALLDEPRAAQPQPTLCATCGGDMLGAAECSRCQQMEDMFR